MGDLWNKQDEKVDMEKEPDAKGEKKLIFYICVV